MNELIKGNRKVSRSGMGQKEIRRKRGRKKGREKGEGKNR
jgi:hypothetical protein